ncbi:MAG: FHA domain-containing protein, partial [Planctomycetes bacterium]|nr:FHA domain-containing protein [Planctomycetota bacterium]
MIARLVVQFNRKTLREIALSKPVFTIGRLPDNDLELNDNLCSRHHCEIVLRDSKYLVNDLRSANGTMVNNKKITSQSLQDNDEIQIGSYTLIFKQEQQAGMPFGMPSQTDKVAPRAFESDIVKGLDEISASYRVNIKDIFAKGESLSATPLPQELHKTEGKKFFLLYQLGKAVTQASSLREVLDIAMTSIFDFINAERGILMLLDSTRGELTPQIAHHRHKKAPQEFFAVSHTITSKVIKDRVSIITSDALSDARFSMGASIAQQNIRSALCVPLWEKDEILGVVYLDNLVKSHSFNNDDLDLLTAIANQIAIRIKQEDLYEELRKEALARGNLERYHSPDVVEMILSQGVKMDVDERQVTVMFADIQNFTTLSEKMPPSEIAQMLNDFFETTTRIVFEHKGSVNKYIGDSIMAIFGAPVPLADHPAQTVQAALKMVQELTRLRHTDNIPYNIRIGVNTGVVVAGNIGSQKRIEYTVVGDVVNIASRLNQYGAANQVVIGEETYKFIKDINMDIVTKDLGSVK